MARHKPLDIEYLRTRLSYCAETGVLTWLPIPVAASRSKTWNTKYAGKPAGTVNHDGYVMVLVSGRRLLAHRVCWALHYGDQPPPLIDHDNRVRSDNRAVNLKEATATENLGNMTGYSASGAKGVYLTAEGNWKATICKHGVRHHLGTYSDIETAAKVYERAANDLYGDFACVEHRDAKTGGVSPARL